MKILNLNPSVNTSAFNILATAIGSAALLILMSASVMAQSVSPRPVARLLSPPSNEVESSGPRRVSLETAAAIANEAPSSPSLNDVNPIERRAFEETNQARVKNGLAPLMWDGQLWRLARAHSEQMAIQKFFAHETPAGLQLKDRARASQIRFRVIGENIAYNKGYDDPGGFAVERWMISSGHRANILYAGFQSAAIGSYVAADGSTYLTQLFISRY